MPRPLPGVSRAGSLLAAARLLAGVGLLAGCAGCNSGQTAQNELSPGRPQQARLEVAAEVKLTEYSDRSGINFVYDNGRAAGFHTIVESLGGGVGMLDFDGDGWLDLFYPGGGKFDTREATRMQTSGLPSGLFRNLGHWKFSDVTAAAGVGDAPHYTHGCAVGDFNSDGFADLLVTGYGGLQLFQNQGDGTFQEVHQPAGLLDDSWSTGAAWGDLNGDGHLDLYVDHYVDWSPQHNLICPGPTRDKPEICSPRKYNPLPDVVYYSQGDGTFRDASSKAGLSQEGKGLGVLLADLDHDGDLDIYVANDTVDNFLYLNDGHGVFQEVGVLNGVARNAVGGADGSMGVDISDYNADGLPDIWVANFEEEAFALYRNEGGGLFAHVSQGTGVTALAGLFVGFGTAFVDIDQDGDEDIVVSNGHVINYPTAAPVRQVPLLLINEQGHFNRAAASSAGYFSRPHRGRGLAVGDLDGDGDPDLAFTHDDAEPAGLVATEPTTGGEWLRVHLIGRTSNREAIGARLVLKTSQGEQLRHVRGGGSYLSACDPRPYWGIPAGATISGLTIHWPMGTVQEVPRVAPNQTLTIVEPHQQQLAQNP